MGRYDAIVVGGGHNGLTAALTLAAAGRKVVVVERAAEPGGICARREFAPGYHAAGLLPETSLFRGDLIAALGLERHGLALETSASPVLVPNGGDGLLLDADPSETAARLERTTPDDATALTEWRRFLGRVAPAMRRLLDAPPPPLRPRQPAELLRLGGTAWALRRLGAGTMTEVLRVMPMSVADWMREHFDSECLAAALAAPALWHGVGGPWAAGTAGALLLAECARERSIAGGPPALVEALVKAAGAAGVDLETAAEVTRIRLASGRVAAVELASGELLDTDLVIAACSPKTALLDLVGRRYLPAGTERALAGYRTRGIVSVLLLAVAGELEVVVPAESPLPRPVERLRIGAASLDGLERAFDAAKYRRTSERPYLEVWIPSLSTPGLAPEGGHVVTVLVHCTPYDLDGGWSTPVREALIQAVVHELNEHLPGLRERLAGGRLLAPPDLERELALPGGHLGHGELALDQFLFLRPARELARYRTPIHGLYLGSSGSHPGPGITGMPGRLAAQSALADTD